MMLFSGGVGSVTFVVRFNDSWATSRGSWLWSGTYPAVRWQHNPLQPRPPFVLPGTAHCLVGLPRPLPLATAPHWSSAFPCRASSQTHSLPLSRACLPPERRQARTPRHRQQQSSLEPKCVHRHWCSGGTASRHPQWPPRSALQGAWSDVGL